MTNHDRLKKLVIDVFLLDPAEFRLDLAVDKMDTWDSLGAVSLAVGIHDTFGCEFAPEEAVGIQKVQDIVGLLSAKGISFDD